MTTRGAGAGLSALARHESRAGAGLESASESEGNRHEPRPGVTEDRAPPEKGRLVEDILGIIIIYPCYHGRHFPERSPCRYLFRILMLS